MVISTLAFLGNRDAAGLLARTALALSGPGNPAAEPSLPGEGALRSSMRDEVRAHLGLRPDDASPDALDRIGDALDEEADRLLGPIDTDAALRRLAERGDLPSDLYEIAIHDGIQTLYGQHFPFEDALIRTTIRSPNREQHYGRTTSAREPSLVSLFTRDYRTRYPFKDFTHLVAADRDGLSLIVHQAWHLYASEVDLVGATYPIDKLRAFALRYGIDVTLNGVRGRFFLMTDQAVPPTLTIKAVGRGPFTISQFFQKRADGGVPQPALVMMTNLDAYRETLHRMMVPAADILDERLHVTPKPAAAG